jgi:hypothetical protein
MKGCYIDVGRRRQCLESGHSAGETNPSVRTAGRAAATPGSNVMTFVSTAKSSSGPNAATENETVPTGLRARKFE